MLCCANETACLKKKAMTYQTLGVSPISGACGAIVEGVDLSRDLDNATTSDLHQALLDHCVISFRGQHLTPERHLALAPPFAPLNPHHVAQPLPAHPQIL